MTATCPNDPAHKRFVTVAHVTEDWMVDEHGEFLEVLSGGPQEVLARPLADNCWSCKECGAAAKVTIP